MSIPLLDGAVTAVYPFVVHLATVLSPVGAIVLCTALLRFLLLPLTLAAVRGERSRVALAPRIAALRKQHAKDPARLGTELAELYRSTGTSPFAGFLPLLLQSPTFIVWYRIFTAPRIGGHANAPAGARVSRGGTVGAPVRPSARVRSAAGRARGTGGGGDAAGAPGRCRDRFS